MQEGSGAGAALGGGVWPQGPPWPPQTAWAVGVASRAQAALRAVGRHGGEDAGCLKRGEGWDETPAGRLRVSAART